MTAPVRFRPRVLIADDHQIFAEGLKALLEQYCDVIGVVPDGRKLLAEAVKQEPDVVIVDIGMPLLNGLDAARRVMEQLPKVKIIFLTMQDDANLAAAAAELGPVGFVLKHSASKELLIAMDYVLHNTGYLTPKLRGEDWVEMKARARQFTKDLTSRQRDIVQLFAEGRAIKEIAGLLNLSEKTVEFHKHHIMELFNLQTNADLVLFALKRRLIALDPQTTSWTPEAPRLKIAV